MSGNQLVQSSGCNKSQSKSYDEKQSEEHRIEGGF